MKNCSPNAREQPYIGGIFATDDDDKFMANPDADKFFLPNINGAKRVFFETAADAIAAELKQVFPSGAELWLPENFCRETVSRILLKFPLLRALHYTKPEQAFAEKNPRAVLLLHFNKFDPEISKLASRKAPGMHIIEDFVQCPFEITKLQGNFAITSLRKICTAEISVCYSSQQLPGIKKTSDYLKLKREAMLLRKEFLQTGDKKSESTHLEKIAKANAASISPEIYMADEVAINHFTKLNFAAIHKQRKANCKFLREALGADFQTLPSDYFFLMLRLKNRDAIRQALATDGIFAPIHWADSGHANNLLSLPIDQRYTEADMAHFAGRLRNLYSHPA